MRRRALWGRVILSYLESIGARQSLLLVLVLQDDDGFAVLIEHQLPECRHRAVEPLGTVTEAGSKRYSQIYECLRGVSVSLLPSKGVTHYCHRFSR